MNEANSAPPDGWKEQFMACLAVPVRADMRQLDAIALRDKNKPDSLFRYRALNQEREFENIERQQVWLSQPLSFNDPFDSSFSILHQDFVLPKAAQQEEMMQFSQVVGDTLSESEIAEFANFQNLPDERLRSLIRKAFPNEPIGFADMILDVFHKVGGKYQSDQVRQLNEFAKQNLSVCCFCEARDEILMWTHYADEHRGCCIEFDVRTLFVPGAVGSLLPVIYKDELFDVTPYYSAIAVGGGNNLAAILAACHKAKKWSYEREWRIVTPFHYPPGQNNWRIPVKSITIGLKAEKKAQDRLLEIAQRLKVPLFVAVQSLTEQKLTFQPLAQLT